MATTEEPDAAGAARSVLRAEGQSGASVGYAELFFDLVYVFAVTQLSHFLLAHDDAVGALETAILFGAVWWAWTFMTWATNWLDPDRFWVRLMIFAMMLVGLTMGAAIPKAFGAAGPMFAIAYASSQVLRSAFVAFAARRDRPEVARNMTHATIWFALTLPLWVAGGFLDGWWRMGLWAAAILIELAGPLARFRLPGARPADTGSLGISGEHMAERCGLFVIVALGEGILVTGATVAGQRLTTETLGAFVVAFLGSVAFWWIYFDRGADKGAEHIEQADDAGRVARDNYAYLHLPIVAGIVVAAVADELVVAHPLGHLSVAFLLTTLGGPALFLAGCMAFKRQFIGFHPRSHLVGLAGFAVLAAGAVWLHPLPIVLAGAAVAVLFAVAIWEWAAFHRGHEIPRPADDAPGETDGRTDGPLEQPA